MTTYFIVNVGTEQKYRKRNCVCDAMYDTEKGAKTACTKLNKKYSNTKQWEVMTHAEFLERFPVKYEMVRNLMSGKMVKQAVGTPLCCDVSSETYWSM